MARIKVFTVDQAEKMLPLVRRIVGDIVARFGARENLVAARQALPKQPNAGSKAEEEAFRIEREIEAQESDILRCQKELEDLGAELKDYRLGLPDFYSRFDGRIVYLCWKLDEGDVLAWWHDISAGFRGRQPITPFNRHRFKGLEPGERFVEIKGEG